MEEFNDFFDSTPQSHSREPKFDCPKCGTALHTEWVDNGFGPYAVQVSPYMCECGWGETGCQECIEAKCFSWSTCGGRAVILKPGEYRCAACQKVYLKTISDDDAAKEYEEVFGKAAKELDTEIVCDDCYNQLMAQHQHDEPILCSCCGSSTVAKEGDMCTVCAYEGPAEF